MKLVKASVTNFRSAEDTGEFDIDHVTCLVGKNESGKSAVLTALAALNPHAATPVKLEKERDYPRRKFTSYAATHGANEAVAVSTTWQLDDGELAEIRSEFGASVLKTRDIEIFRRYGDTEPQWRFDVDEPQAIQHLLAQAGFKEEQLSALRAAKTIGELAALLAVLPATSAPQQQLVAKLNAWGTVERRIHEHLAPRLPSFMYFSTYDRMVGAVQLEQLASLKNAKQLDRDENRGLKLFAEFFEYAGASLDEITDVATYETFNAKLKAASNNITDQIAEYWTQNPDLSVQIEIDQARPGDPAPFDLGTVARARIYNHLHRVDTAFSERSAGFVWFFSFLVKFAQVKAIGKPVVLLLDEPGLTLHGKAQADLLRFFEEKLAPYHQIVYSTHSPFMVQPDKLLCTRIVEDEIESKGARRTSHGTKVRADLSSRDPDTLFPLQGALGYALMQSLFIGKHTLLVQGPSDILYLQALSEALKKRGRVGLDARWTLCPSGGIGNIRAFVSLFGANGSDIAVLADQTRDNLRKIEELRRRNEILTAGRVFTVADFVGKAEADIEDLFDADVYAALLNKAYQLPVMHHLSAGKLESPDATSERVVKRAEAALRAIPIPLPPFDHFTPAAWLIRNPDFLNDVSLNTSTAFDRAEKIFRFFNALLLEYPGRA
jgi:predicted ATP-dependent endonuclease of OLD family